MTNLSYTLIFVFLCLHTLGGHFTYAKVPYDRWCARLIGCQLTKLLHLRRNHYDRLVHFAFGLLLAYPTYEFCAQHAQARAAWNYVLAWSLIVVASALFELLECLAAAGAAITLAVTALA